MTTYINLPLSGASPFWGNAVPTAASLPLSGNVIGEAILVMDVATIVYWDGASWVDVSPTPTGTANTFAGFDALGDLAPIPGWAWDNVTDGAYVVTGYDPTLGGLTTHNFQTEYNPTSDTVNDITMERLTGVIGSDNAGFYLGDPVTGQGGLTVLNLSTRPVYQGDFGYNNLLTLTPEVGAGVHPVSGHTLTGIAMYPYFAPLSTLENFKGNVINFNSSAGSAIQNYYGFVSGVTIAEPMGGSYNAFSAFDNLDDVAGDVRIFNSNVNAGDINSFSGSQVGGTFGNIANYASGYYANVQAAASNGHTGFADGSQYVLLTGTYQGFSSSAVLTNTPGANIFNSSVQIPLSTGIVKAFNDGSNLTTGTDYNSASFTPTLGTLSGYYQGININPTITSAGNASGISVSMQNVTASGNKFAIQANGNINFDGGRFFQGSEIVTPVDGGGQPNTINSMISSVNVPANSTTANADIIGLNTAQILTLGANSTTTSGPFGLGMATLAFPTVLTMNTGATLDHINAAVFAVSLDAANTGGTVDEMNLARTTAIPQGGSQTITNLRGYYADLPFGDPGTNSWGVYTKDFPENFFEGAVKIGGTPGSTDKSTSGTPGLEVENYVLLKSTAGPAPKLSLTEAPGGSDYVVSLEAPAGLAADLPFILPVADGTVGQSAVTDGAGQLSFASRVVGPGAATANALPRYDGTTGDILLDSLVTVDDDGILTMGGTTGFFRPPTLTTTQRDALAAVDGAMVFNITTSRFQGYFSGSWADLHGWGS